MFKLSLVRGRYILCNHLIIAGNLLVIGTIHWQYINKDQHQISWASLQSFYISHYRSSPWGQCRARWVLIINFCLSLWLLTHFTQLNAVFPLILHSTLTKLQPHVFIRSHPFAANRLQWNIVIQLSNSFSQSASSPVFAVVAMNSNDGHLLPVWNNVHAQGMFCACECVCSTSLRCHMHVLCFIYQPFKRTSYYLCWSWIVRFV